MRIKRTVSKSDTARRELASEPAATALKVLAPPAFDPSAEPFQASLEAMFRRFPPQTRAMAVRPGPGRPPPDTTTSGNFRWPTL